MPHKPSRLKFFPRKRDEQQPKDNSKIELQIVFLWITTVRVEDTGVQRAACHYKSLEQITLSGCGARVQYLELLREGLELFIGLLLCYSRHTSDRVAKLYLFTAVIHSKLTITSWKNSNILI